MGFSGIKITGHSGTEFKHRKAFASFKQVSKNPSYKNIDAPNNAQFEKRDYSYKVNKLEQLIKIGFLLPLFLGTLFFAIYLFFDPKIGWFEPLYFNNAAYLENKESEEKRLNREAYAVLVKSGYEYLESNNLDQAHWEFYRALKMYSHAKGANLGMTKTLAIKCQTKGVYCKEAKDYYESVIRINSVSKKEKEEIKAILQIE